MHCVLDDKYVKTRENAMYFGASLCEMLRTFLGSIAQTGEQTCRANEGCGIPRTGTVLVMYQWSTCTNYVDLHARHAHIDTGRDVRQTDVMRCNVPAVET